MKENYTQQRGEDFDEAGDIAIRLKVLAGEIYNMQTTVEWLKRQLFPSTATGEFLDRFAAQRGLARNPAVKARGQLKFSVNEQKTTAVTIPRGTVVSTDSELPVRLYTTEDS
ncbi:MAG: baseplate J/gp47 family protein, partial [Ruminococcus sp.]|nr:baseplate J/gp47 family protein [Ruminococcus sp.]